MTDELEMAPPPFFRQGEQPLRVVIASLPNEETVNHAAAAQQCVSSVAK